jgi:hypothetical protein
MYSSNVVFKIARKLFKGHGETVKFVRDPLMILHYLSRYSRGVLNPRDSECRSQDPLHRKGRTEKASHPQSSNKPVQPRKTSDPPANQTKQTQLGAASQGHTSEHGSQAQANMAGQAQTTDKVHGQAQTSTPLVQSQPTPSDQSNLEPQKGQADLTGNIGCSEEKRQGAITAVNDSSDYEEQSFRSVASIRLSQPSVLPPYKRERLPDGDTAAASLTAEDDDLTYERLGRQFRDLTAKVRRNFT